MIEQGEPIDFPALETYHLAQALILKARILPGFGFGFEGNGHWWHLEGEKGFELAWIAVYNSLP